MGVGVTKAQAQAEISAQLEVRRPEIEGAALARVCAIADPIEASDPEYLDGLKLAISAAVDYALAAVEVGEEHAPPVPTALLGQARLAARNAVPLEIVLRRYFAGYTLFGDFLIRGADGILDGPRLQRLLQTQATLFDRLITAVSEAYEQERERRLRSSEQRRVERVQRLLDGEPLDPTTLAYELDAWHVGAVATGQGALEALRGVAESLDRVALLVRPAEEVVWVWFGGRRAVSTAEILATASANWPGAALVGFGEAVSGLEGWRLTHRQARAALQGARRGDDRLARYADVGLLVSVLQDDVLVASLRQLYLDPLAEASDGGKSLRDTLRAYLATGRNVSSAAAALGVSRRTVANRLRTIEEKLGKAFGASTADIEVALRLGDLDQAPHHSPAAQI